MIGFRLTMVRMRSLRVMSATARIIGIGPTASTRSMRVPFSINCAQLVGDEALVGVAAVVGGDHRRVADLAHLVFENDEFFVAPAEDGDHAIAGALQRGGRRIGHGRAHAAAHHHHGAELLDLRRLAQRPDDVENAVAGFERIEQVGGFADGLHHNVDGALCPGRSVSMVSGMRSPVSLTRMITNCPGLCLRAMRGASITKRLMPGAMN